MKIDITKVSYEGREFEFGEAKLTIRPYPMSRQDVTIKDGAIILSGTSARDMFSYCLTKWDNVIGADDQPLKLTADVKQKIYDFKLVTIEDAEGEKLSMADFVIRTARDMSGEIASDTKN